MRKVMAMAAAGVLAGGVLVVGASAAQAATVQGDPCAEIDYTGGIGTTFVFPLSGCFDGSYYIEDGEPTVVLHAGGGTAGQPLIWYQSIGRTGSACPDGWSPSYAEWPNGGKGGPTCDKSIVWGMGPGDATGSALSITINGIDDFVNLDSEADNYVTGCNVDDDFYPDHVVIDCDV